jgi:hypothetical protein
MTVELQLYVTLWLFSGASSLDMIWYAIEVNSMQRIFWKTVVLIDEALDNFNLPQDAIAIAQMVDGWAVKQEARHGFAEQLWQRKEREGSNLKYAEWPETMRTV